jgi:hypothetical protein
MKTRRYADETEVPAEKTRAELDGLLQRNGATQRATYIDDASGTAAIGFTLGGRMMRLEVKIARASSTDAPANRGGVTIEAWVRNRNAQAERSAWRRLLLVVKAKLELIADGGSTVEREFLADILLPDGRTVHQMLAAPLGEAYATGQIPTRLLGPWSGEGQS